MKLTNYRFLLTSFELFRDSLNVSHVRRDIRTSDMIVYIKFIIRIRQNNGSNCYNRLCRVPILGRFIYQGFESFGGVVTPAPSACQKAPIMLLSSEFGTLSGYCLNGYALQDIWETWLSYYRFTSLRQKHKISPRAIS